MDWTNEFSVAITVCDTNGIIIEMNHLAMKTFEKYGGASLIGRSVFDVHPEPALTKLKKIMREKIVNCYTIEKNGVKKLIYQAPWFKNGEYRGFVEISMEIPFQMPNFIRS